MIEKTFWAKRRVFITGHTGFKGSWLGLWLSSMGSVVRGFALEPPTQPNMFELVKLRDVTDTVIGDIRNLDALTRSMAAFKPEVVFHLAAQSLVRESYQNPVDTYATNVLGTVNLLESVRKVPSVRAVVVITSDKCYENREWVWGYRENEAMGGYDPYSASKGCEELVVSSYRRSFFNPDSHEHTRPVALASARAGNVIGGGDWAADRLIPDIVRSLVKGTTVTIRSPHAIRPWQHVLEPLSGYLLLALCLVEKGFTFADAWNFGPSDEDVRSVEWIVKRVCEFVPGNKGYRIDSAPQPHEAGYLKLDSSKARRMLGWQPRWSLDDALRQIVDWTLAYSRNEDLRRISLEQIAAYESMQR